MYFIKPRLPFVIRWMVTHDIDPIDREKNSTIKAKDNRSSKVLMTADFTATRLVLISDEQHFGG